MKTVYYHEKQERSCRLHWLDSTGAVHEVMLKAHMTMGRMYEGGTADIQLDSEYVSRQHGEFVQIESSCYYRDVGSTNGTWKNGVKLLPGKTTILRDGDILKIGDMSRPDAPDNVILLYTTRGDEGERWEIFTPPKDAVAFQIGRDVSSKGGIQLSGMDISRYQCTIYQTMTGWALENNSTTNPTLLDGNMLSGKVSIPPRAVIRMANNYMIYDGERFHILSSGRPLTSKSWDDDAKQQGEAYGHSLPRTSENGDRESSDAGTRERLEIHIVRRSAKRRWAKIDLLKDIQLTVECGECVLILGGSGAGKTTFLNAVMGYEPADGQILFKNRDMYRDFDSMKYEIGYVPQEDLLRKGDSVSETLNNAAEMRLPRRTTEAERLKAVEETLVTFGLDRERNQLVSKLSGGQRKRLSIAVEYIGQPALFFLDEPDSGLDGVMARSLMENLRFIADMGKIVMVITHAPDRVADLFDKVIVLAKSNIDNCGHLAFYGRLDEARAFFETDSMEGIVRKLNRTDEGGEGMADSYIKKFKRYREDD